MLQQNRSVWSPFAGTFSSISRTRIMQGHASQAGKVHLPFAMASKRRRPWPLAPRQALLSLQGFHPAEAAGLYTEPVPPGFESSIVKLEQRLAWSAALETCRDAAWKLAHLPPG